MNELVIREGVMCTPEGKLAPEIEPPFLSLKLNRTDVYPQPFYDSCVGLFIVNSSNFLQSCI